MSGLVAEYDAPEPLIAAARAARDAGRRRFDAYSPFPLHELEPLLGIDTRPIPWIMGVAAVVGALVQYGALYWMSAIDWPINVGGRSLTSWPAAIPTVIIVTILWAAVAALIGMAWLCRLPRYHHPVFDVPGFERASDDRFFLLLADEPGFDPANARRLLGGARRIHELAT